MKSFYCTAYNTPSERYFKKEKIPANGIKDGLFREDFLAAVKMNGSGKPISGKHIQYNPAKGTFSRVDAPLTATGTAPKAGKTIAVDPYFIPRAKVNGKWKKATIYIRGIGRRIAEDGGGSIKGYKIDVYKGEGKGVVEGWSNTYRKVTLESID